MAQTLVRLIGALALGAALETCGTDSTGPVTTPDPVGSVTVTPLDPTLALGDTLHLQAQVRDQAGHVLANRAVTWSSAGPAVATISPTGLVTGVGLGSVAITATSERHSGQAQVTVTAIPPPEDLGGNWDWTAQVTSLNGRACNDTGSYTFVQNGTAIAGLSERVGTCTGPQGTTLDASTDSLSTGMVKGVVVSFVDDGYPQCAYAGTVSPTSRDSLSGTVSCADSINRPRGTWSAVREPLGAVLVTPPASTIRVGLSTNLQVEERTPSGARAFGRSVTWSSGDRSVASVSSIDRYQATVNALQTGQTIVTATAGGVSGQTSITVPPPVPLSAGVATGTYHSCALTAGGAAYCWGANFIGQLGSGHSDLQSTVPELVAGNHTYSGLTAGTDFTCGLDPQGVAWCWGDNFYGQLGSGTNSSSNAPVPVAGGLTFTALTAGGYHACGLAPGGAAYCWGLNGNGQLGIGGSTSSNVPVPVSGALAFTAISAGYAHTCGVSQSGAGFCWGANVHGQLGDSSSGYRDTPTPIYGALVFATISAGTQHTCGVVAGGAAYCWGGNGDGAVGDGTNSDQIAPVPVSGMLQFTALAAGRAHTCGITVGGAAYCWGSNSSGQLGNGGLIASTTPTAVSGSLTFLSMATRGDQYEDSYGLTIVTDHTCAITTGGVTYCWGANDSGQLGNGGIDTYGATPSPAKVIGQP